MSPNSPQSNYSKKPVKRVRLVKFGPPKTKGLFEEYFYGFLAAIFVVLFTLLVAGGMETSTATVTALWVAVFTWFGWQLKRYFREKSAPAPIRKHAGAAKAIGKSPAKPAAIPLSPNLKPMIGPQWPKKTAGTPGQAGPAPQNGKPKPAFVYERPTLPDRKPKLPANWPGQPHKKVVRPQDKKTK